MCPSDEAGFMLSNKTSLGSVVLTPNGPKHILGKNGENCQLLGQ